MDVARYVVEADRPEEAVELNFERLPDEVITPIEKKVRRKKKQMSFTHTAGIRISLVAEDGLTLSYTLTREAFRAWVHQAGYVLCDG